MLVAPVLDPSWRCQHLSAARRLVRFLHRQALRRRQDFSAHYATDATPVFVRDGAIVPEQPASAYSDARPLDRLILDLYGHGKGHFDLYEDDGTSLAYTDHAYALTSIDYSTGADGVQQLVIAPTSGTFEGQVQRRSYELHIHATGKPQGVTVDGQPFDHWSWDADHMIATFRLPERNVRVAMKVAWRPLNRL
jgi:alpha-glucosidase (family GH31 glycosyl hydrolase)